MCKFSASAHVQNAPQGRRTSYAFPQITLRSSRVNKMLSLRDNNYHIVAVAGCKPAKIIVWGKARGTSADTPRMGMSRVFVRVASVACPEVHHLTDAKGKNHSRCYKSLPINFKFNKTKRDISETNSEQVLTPSIALDKQKNRVIQHPVFLFAAATVFRL